MSDFFSGKSFAFETVPGDGGFPTSLTGDTFLRGDNSLSTLFMLLLRFWLELELYLLPRDLERDRPLDLDRDLEYARFLDLDLDRERPLELLLDTLLDLVLLDRDLSGLLLEDLLLCLGFEFTALFTGSAGMADPAPKSKASSFFDSNCFLAATKLVNPELAALG